ncbi:MAG: copper amine oxidase N-terminal domain-containing protein [Butyricicoccus pullicaecorum]|nr:copper amine oxidase N-terminal domain-containing protein [Butyricicoccus pullicaecorum]
MNKNVLAILAAATLSLSAASATSLVVDGTPITTDVPPIVVDGRTLVPVRVLFESLGATVGWDEVTQTATATKGETVVSVQIGSTTAQVSGVAKTLDVPAQTIEGRTMVPARFVAESLGATVAWDNATETVKISTANQSAPSSSAPDKATPAEKTTTPTKPSTPAPSKPDSSASTTVYITKTGKRYHYDGSCNGGTYIPSTLAEAKERGLTPCNKCVQ